LLARFGRPERLSFTSAVILAGNPICVEQVIATTASGAIVTDGGELGHRSSATVRFRLGQPSGSRRWRPLLAALTVATEGLLLRVECRATPVGVRNQARSRCRPQSERWSRLIVWYSVAAGDVAARQPHQRMPPLWTDGGDEAEESKRGCAHACQRSCEQ
jgi:hypothetical protein